MQPLTENAQEYLLVFRHLGLITSCPRWVLVFPGKMGNLHNGPPLPPPPSPAGPWLIIFAIYLFDQFHQLLVQHCLQLTAHQGLGSFFLYQSLNHPPYPFRTLCSQNIFYIRLCETFFEKTDLFRKNRPFSRKQTIFESLILGFRTCIAFYPRPLNRWWSEVHITYAH